MKRGEVWWINFDPSVGGEIRKTRPAVIISNDVANTFLNRLQVIPLTSKVEKVYASEAIITLNQKPCKAMADQLTTVSKTRCSERIGMVGENDMAVIERIIKLHLGLV